MRSAERLGSTAPFSFGKLSLWINLTLKAGEETIGAAAG
jgi:hypothetical protein